MSVCLGVLVIWPIAKIFSTKNKKMRVLQNPRLPPRQVIDDVFFYNLKYMYIYIYTRNLYYLFYKYNTFINRAYFYDYTHIYFHPRFFCLGRIRD